MTTTSGLGISHSELKRLGGQHTAMEIARQPKLWLETYEALCQQQHTIQAYIQDSYMHPDLRIILTGAGSSAFIGNILQGTFQQYTQRNVYAVATTDLVSHPLLYLNPSAPTLLISFGRSGNSPESMAAVELADQICENCLHFFITCNPYGQLALKSRNSKKCFLFTLPAAAEDQSLAMTGSFTSMLLTGLLLPRIHELDNLKEQVKTLADYGERILHVYADKLRDVAKLDFKRAVFLGSGPLLGVARESQLKLQELTDGRVICKYDSFLGLRHGPKAVIDPSTLLVYLFSNNPYAHQYEIDLVDAINRGEKGMFQLGISESKAVSFPLDLQISLSEDQKKIEEAFLSVCHVLPSQLLGFYKSLDLGLQPDMPSVNQAITRVVQGVAIYPFPSSNKLKEIANAGRDENTRRNGSR
jgi:tagatose-6-phosphate ketose/aldose isomerase